MHVDKTYFSKNLVKLNEKYEFLSGKLKNTGKNACFFTKLFGII